MASDKEDKIVSSTKTSLKDANLQQKENTSSVFDFNNEEDEDDTDFSQFKGWSMNAPAVKKNIREKGDDTKLVESKQITEYECEICGKRSFADIDDCIAHEVVCRKEQRKLKEGLLGNKDDSLNEPVAKKDTQPEDDGVNDTINHNDDEDNDDNSEEQESEKGEDLVVILMQQLVRHNKAENDMVCKHCNDAKFHKASTIKRLAKWKRKSKIVEHILNCSKCPTATKNIIKESWSVEIANKEKSSSNIRSQNTALASESDDQQSSNQKKDKQKKESSKLVQSMFAQDESGAWSCQKCHMMPFSLRAGGAVIWTSPTQSSIERHRKVCCGNKPYLTAAKDAILGMTDTISKMRFDTLIESDFKSIVRILVGGSDELVTLFTDVIREEWFSHNEGKCHIPIIKSWDNFPAEKIDEEAAVDAMAKFARSGIGFDFVSNQFFVRYVDIIAPGYKLPTASDLMACW
mmetsp:Transcript_20613/g.29901  ORF Transcript_20613/g.29901 Transcript_20613/m.29901 type:complete len:461 (+) Transcript_20613:998-2380(+)